MVRKAGEETRKVEEIAFYNSLDVENKKAALRERLAGATSIHTPFFALSSRLNLRQIRALYGQLLVAERRIIRMEA